MVEIVKIQAADWSQYRSVRLDALRESPDAFGSTFDEEASNPDSWWRQRLVNCDAGQDRPLFAMAGGDVVGLAWGKLDVDAAEKIGQVYQMWVRGNARGLGIGRLLRVLSSVGSRVVRRLRRFGRVLAKRLRIGCMPLWFHRGREPEPLRPGASVLCRKMELTL
ncbi:MAG: hypothetical protein R3E83_19710 [Burkholderiaceae bacterium]